MAKLNLSKFKSIPTKEVKIDGFEETVTISPIAGFGLLKIQDLAKKFEKDQSDIEVQEEMIKLALKWGCKCSDEDVNFLIENDLIACMTLTKEVMEFSAEYNQEKFKESDLAKKKLKK